MIQDNVKRVLEEIAESAVKAGRDPGEITLVGVTKTVGCAEMQELMDAGVMHLGENRVQSLVEKYEVLKDAPTWHLIGHLQTNKVKYIADKVTMIHSVDSFHLAEEIDRQFAKCGRVANILLQVNVSGEESKFGVTPEAATELAHQVADFKNLSVSGLMTMAPLAATPAETRKIFADLQKLSVDIQAKKYDNINMGHLSMGMSGDFREAIMEGATLVRIGSALFI